MPYDWNATSGWLVSKAMDKRDRSRKFPKRIVATGAQGYELTKIDVAEALIQAAVRLFFEGAHPVPIYQLASSAREILTTIGEKVGVETILHSIAKRKAVPVKTLINQAHKFAKFFKHANSDPTEKLSFSEFEIDHVLLLACHDFGRVTGGMPIEAQVFEAWAQAGAWRRIADVPFRRQAIKQAIRLFPGIRSADRKTQKRIGLEALKRVEHDPAYQMEIQREVKLPSKTGGKST